MRARGIDKIPVISRASSAFLCLRKWFLEWIFSTGFPRNSLAADKTDGHWRNVNGRVIAKSLTENPRVGLE
jgi:hypothetical protein